MPIKTFLRWLYRKLSNYNIFILEENEYIDENEDTRDALTIIKHQKYSTRLYALLLILFIYIIFFIVFVTPQSTTVTVENLTPSLFKQLQDEHRKTLSCPCSTAILPYKNFVSVNVSFHPICASLFVTEKWVKALYIPFASSHLVMDFRTTARCQFELLASLCSLSEIVVSQALNDIDSNQIVTIQLLSEDEVQSQVIETIKLVRASANIQIISYLNFLQISTRLNSLISALNTNAHTMVRTYYSGKSIVTDITSYIDKNVSLGKDNDKPCNFVSSVTPSGFYLQSYGYRRYFEEYWPYESSPPSLTLSAEVDGFFGACTPLEALLGSTLDCLYKIECLNLLADYFPDFNQLHFNITESVLSSIQENLTLYNHFTDLFTKEWSPNINYIKYFSDCSSVLCSYTTTNENNFVYTIVFLLSLYNGLTILLRLISPFLIKRFTKLKLYCSFNRINLVYWIICYNKLIRWIKLLNMFQSREHRQADEVKQQRIITRIYLLLLAISIISLFLFIWFDTQITTKTVLNPSIISCKNLQDQYSNTLKCPCSTTTISYQTFISIVPTFHQVCSSDFVSDAWISLLMATDPIGHHQWILKTIHRSQLLSAICKLASQTTNDAIQRFLIRSLVTSDVLTEVNFDAQLNTTINQFLESIILNFNLVVNTVHLFTQVDQPYKLPRAAIWNISMTKDENNSDVWQFIPFLTDVDGGYSKSTSCICATNPYCQIASSFSYSDDIPGLVNGCFALDSILLSTLECFYEYSDCLSTVISHIYREYTIIDVDVPWFNLQPLIYDPLWTRFAPNTTLSIIINAMMIESWNNSASFNLYYETCAPSYCTYSYIARTYTYTEIIIKVVSTISGLTGALRLITPLLVNFVFRLLKPKNKRQTQGVVNQKLSKRIKLIWQKLFIFFYNHIVKLNLVSLRTFGNNVDRDQAKRLGQLSTYLYIIMLIIAIIIIGLHVLVQPQILSETFIKPSLEIYERLLHNHRDTLTCPCSLISSPYNRYITIEPIFHQICSSPFASNEWRISVTTHLVPDLSIYSRRDYRRFLSAHLQLLVGLCNLAKQSVNAIVQQVISSLFITAQLLSKSEFDVSINSTIEDRKTNAPIAFKRLVFLLRSVNQGNKIVSAYGTNFEYLAYPSDVIANIMLSKPVVYDDECSCDFNASCTTSANFFKANSLDFAAVKGLKMGCKPSESFLASTLECFYNSLCINLIYDYVNSTTNISALTFKSISRFSIDTPIINLVNDLFIENWQTTINYSSYFDQCSPTFCTYTYIQKFNSLHTITRLLGLYGGLTIILKWICPMFVYLVVKIYQRWKRPTNLIVLINTIEMENTDVLNVRDAHNCSRVKLETSMPETKFFVPSRSTFAFGCGILITVIMCILIPTIYVIQQTRNRSSTTIFSNNFTTISATTVSNCQLTFASKMVYETSSDYRPFLVSARDLNADKHLDIIFSQSDRNAIGVMLGYGNGTFRNSMNFGRASHNVRFYFDIGDFNSDNRLDLIFTEDLTGSTDMLIGNNNRIFIESWEDLVPCQYRAGSVAVGDINMDSILDLVIVCVNPTYIHVLLGHGDGSFEEQARVWSIEFDRNSFIVIDDFNGDNRSDLAVNSLYQDKISVLYGNGDGTFRPQPTFLNGNSGGLMAMAVGNFDGDDYLDLACANSWKSNVGIFFGENNGKFRSQKTYSTGSHSSPQSITVADFNGDSFIDIAVANKDTHNIGVLINKGDGTFEPIRLFSTGSYSSPYSLTVGDFNKDNLTDIVVANYGAKNVMILLNRCTCCIH